MPNTNTIKLHRTLHLLFPFLIGGGTRDGMQKGSSFMFKTTLGKSFGWTKVRFIPFPPRLCSDKLQLMQVTSWCFTKALTKLRVKYDTNIMIISLERVKTNAAVRAASFYNSFSFEAIIVSFISLLPIRAHLHPHILTNWKLTTTHSTNTRNVYRAIAKHKAVF